MKYQSFFRSKQIQTSLTRFLILRYLVSLVIVVLISSASIFWLLKNAQSHAISISLDATEKMLVNSIKYEVKHYNFDSLHDSLVAFQRTMHFQRIEVIGSYGKTIANVGSSTEGALPDSISPISSDLGAQYGQLHIWYSDTQNAWARSDQNAVKKQIVIVSSLFLLVIFVLSLLFFRLIKVHVQRPLNALSKHMNKHPIQELSSIETSEIINAHIDSSESITYFHETNQLGSAYSRLELRWLKAVETKNETLEQLRHNHSILLEVLQLAKITVALVQNNDEVQLIGTTLPAPINTLLKSSNTQIEKIIDSASNFNLKTQEISLDSSDNSVNTLLEIENSNGRIWAAHKTNISDYTALLIREVTQERSLEQALVRSEKLKSIGQLSSSIAHDFNNLIASILINIRLIRESIDKNQHIPESTFKGIEVLSAGVAGRISSLRNLAINNSRMLETIDQHQRLLDLETFIAPSLGANIQLKLELNEYSYIKCDTNEFENCIINLLVNAKHAMNDQGKIIIRTRQANELDINYCALTSQPYIAIDVIDEGPGIKQKLINKIFEPFFSTRQLASGTGLGLAQAHAFCTRAGGGIFVNKDYSKGAKFTILLPITTASKNSEKKDINVSSASVKSTNVYILDDNEILGNSIVSLLQLHDINAYFYKSLNELIIDFNNEPAIGVLLSDVHLPDCNFQDVVAFTKSNHTYLKVLFYSGNQESLASIQTLYPDIQTLPKPFQSSVLVNAILNTADKRKI